MNLSIKHLLPQYHATGKILCNEINLKCSSKETFEIAMEFC